MHKKTESEFSLSDSKIIIEFRGILTKILEVNFCRTNCFDDFQKMCMLENFRNLGLENYKNIILNCCDVRPYPYVSHAPTLV